MAAAGGEADPLTHRRIDVNPTIAPDFQAVIMKGTGHYAMLERPAEFNRLFVEYVQGLERTAAPAGYRDGG